VNIMVRMLSSKLEDWEENRHEEIKQLTSKGIIPVEHDMENLPDDVDDDEDDYRD
jgi:hypothetical protein